MQELEAAHEAAIAASVRAVGASLAARHGGLFADLRERLIELGETYRLPHLAQEIMDLIDCSLEAA